MAKKPKYKAKPCAVCGKMFKPTSGHMRYCNRCAFAAYRTSHKEAQRRYRAKMKSNDLS